MKTGLQRYTKKGLQGYWVTGIQGYKKTGVHGGQGYKDKGILYYTFLYAYVFIKHMKMLG